MLLFFPPPRPTVVVFYSYSVMDIDDDDVSLDSPPISPKSIIPVAEYEPMQSPFLRRREPSAASSSVLFPPAESKDGSIRSEVRDTIQRIRDLYVLLLLRENTLNS